MIINRYLISQVLKNQVALLLVLFLIFSCQKLVRLLPTVVAGELPAHLLLFMVGLGFTHMLQLILPLSLFLGILLTYGRLYVNNEIIAMQACGLHQLGLLKAALGLMLFTLLPSASNMLFFLPKITNYEKKVIQDAQVNLGLSAMVKGQFQSIAHTNLLFFMNETQGDRFNGLFLARGRPSNGEDFSILVADSGQIQQLVDGNKLLLLDQGAHYSGKALHSKFQVTNFNSSQVVIGQRKARVSENSFETSSFNTLLRSNQALAKVELHWRLTLFFCTPLMVLLAVPLSVVRQRQYRIIGLFPALLLYLIYFLLQSLIRSAAESGRIVSVAWFWGVSGSYLILGLIFNSRGTFLAKVLPLALRKKIE